jgi:hypothetical protein
MPELPEGHRQGWGSVIGRRDARMDAVEAGSSETQQRLRTWRAIRLWPKGQGPHGDYAVLVAEEAGNVGRRTARGAFKNDRLAGLDRGKSRAHYWSPCS